MQQISLHHREERYVNNGKELLYFLLLVLKRGGILKGSVSLLSKSKPLVISPKMSAPAEDTFDCAWEEGKRRKEEKRIQLLRFTQHLREGA